MNRFIKFDENNISKVILKNSFILVSAMALLLFAIYTPKYYYEYKKNINSTEDHLNNLFTERLKFEVNETEKNIRYRSAVYEKYSLVVLEGELFKLYEKISEDYTGRDPKGKQAVFSKILNRYCCSDSLKYYFIADNDFLIITSKNRSETIKSDFTDIFKKTALNMFPDSLGSDEKIQSVFSGIIKNGSNYIQIRYSDKHKIYYGIIIPKTYFQIKLEEIILKELSQLNLKGSQEYIFVYKLINPEGGKGFAKMLINPNRPDLIGNFIDDDYKDSAGFEFRKEFLRQIGIKGEALVSYYYKDPKTDRIDLKTSYFKLYPEMNWIISQGYYHNEILKIIQADIKRYRNDFYIRVGLIIFLVCTFLTIYYFIFRSFSRRVQATIIKYRSDLEDKNKQLKSEKEKAEQASFEKSRFLANMSHEIRTPMNSIYGMSNILRETELSKDQHEIVDTIKASSDILLRILNDILDLSKIESGTINIEKTNFDLIALIKTVTRPFDLKLRDKKVKFCIELLPADFHKYYLGDSLKIGQILNNLIGNAVKFTRAGSITLKAEIIKETQDSAEIKFCVSDTGIGIPESALEKIFERFSQADISTTRKYGGTGLGLTISKMLVEILGGKLEVASKLNEGSVFSFILELEKVSFSHNENKNVMSNEYLAEKLKKINILVAEDNVLNQKYISALFKKKSANFKIVENGYEVLNELKKNKYDIILMDGQMPEMDGISTAMAIRKSASHYSSIPIVALTASALLDDKIKFLDAGMDDYLSKPIDQDQLFRTIFKYCLDEDIIETAQKNEISAGKTDASYEILDFNDFLIKSKTFGKQVLIDILELLVKDIHKKIELLQSGYEKNDFEAIKFESHSLKGIATNFKAPEFNELCIKLDNQVCSDNFEESLITFRNLKNKALIYMPELTRIISFFKSDFQNIKS